MRRFLRSMTLSSVSPTIRCGAVVSVLLFGCMTPPPGSNEANANGNSANVNGGNGGNPGQDNPGGNGGGGGDGGGSGGNSNSADGGGGGDGGGDGGGGGGSGGGGGGGGNANGSGGGGGNGGAVPVATAQSLVGELDTPLAVTLAGTDADTPAENLTFAVAGQPAFGALSAGTGANLVYTPTAGFAGADSFTFVVSDGANTSPAATVQINITTAGNERWRPLGPGLTGGSPIPSVFALTLEQGTLLAGGNFLNAGGLPARHIARWNGAAWEGKGADMSAEIRAFAVLGGALHACGTPNEDPTRGVVRWDGATWANITNEVWVTSVNAIAVFQGELYITGDFTRLGADQFSRITRWDGTQFRPLGVTTDAGLVNRSGLLFTRGVTLLATDTDLIVGGDFDGVTDGSLNNGNLNITNARNVARWNGSIWRPMSQGLNNTVLALGIHNQQVVAGGRFTQSGTQVRNGIAIWNGSQWLPIGSGVGPAGTAFVSAVKSDGTNLYAGGFFTHAGGATANNVARWDGAAWSRLGSGVTTDQASGIPTVWALELFGPDLIVGGSFDRAGGQNMGRIGAYRVAP